MRKTTSGFTIVELIVVIIVIGIVAAISVVGYSGVQERARDTDRRSDIHLIVEGLDLYHQKHGRYPPGSGSTVINSGWSTTADASWTNLATYLEPFIDKLPMDPKNTLGISVLSTSASHKGTAYAYYSNASNGGTSSCGAATRQMYILVYRLEGSAQENTLDGNCPINGVGPYSGASNYRRVR